MMDLGIKVFDFGKSDFRQNFMFFDCKCEVLNTVFYF